MPEVIAFIDDYAQAVAAPVQTHTRVTAVRRTDAGYLVRTDRGDWHTRAVVLATGACNVPCVPRLAEALPPSIRTLTPIDYRNPDQLERGGVLVVGASATGIQLADEIHRSGRPVTLAVGEHIRAPRTYRGRDIQWWMDAAGVLDQRYDEVDDIERARKVPSLQLIGSPERRTLDLNALGDSGVRLVGRLAGINDGRLQFSGSLANQCALSDLKLGRLLDVIDRFASESGLDGEVEPPHRFAPTRIDASPTLTPGSRPQRHPDHHLGDRLSHRLLMARGAGARPQGPAPPRRRHLAVIRPVRHGPAVPAAAQVGADRRRRRRCPRSLRPRRCLSARPRHRGRRLSWQGRRARLVPARCHPVEPGRGCVPGEPTRSSGSASTSRGMGIR